MDPAHRHASSAIAAGELRCVITAQARRRVRARAWVLAGVGVGPSPTGVAGPWRLAHRTSQGTAHGAHAALGDRDRVSDGAISRVFQTRLRPRRVAKRGYDSLRHIAGV